MNSFNENPNQITLVTLGPLTNIANAIQKDPSLAVSYTHPSPRDAHESRMPSSA